MATTSIRKGYANTARGQIHYAEAGDGPPLLLLSESPRTHRHFQRLLPLLVPHFRVIAIDTPGYGNSDPPPQPVTIPGVASRVVDFLDTMGIARTDVFGIHTGNKIASALAAGHPDRVGRVALVGYTHSIIPEREARNAAIQPIFDGYLPHYAESPDGSHLVRAWAAAHATATKLWWPSRLLFGEKVEAADVENAEAEVIDYLLGWRNTVAMYKAVFAFDLADAFARIEAPALLLELRTAQEAHFAAQADRVVQSMKNARAASLDVAYPSALQTDASRIAEVVLPFLLECSR